MRHMNVSFIFSSACRNKYMNSQYFFARVRTTKRYFAFLLVQLMLSLFVVIVALVQPQSLKSSFTLAAELIVALCIALDMYRQRYSRLVRANSEPQFWRSKGNQLDVAVLALLVIILLFVCLLVPEKPGEQALEADDIILLIVILLRYSLQIGRLVCQIRASH